MYYAGAFEYPEDVALVAPCLYNSVNYVIFTGNTFKKKAQDYI